MAADAWAVVAVLAFWGWVASFLAGIFRTFPAKGEFCAASARIWGIALLVTGTLWIVGLLKAV